MGRGDGLPKRKSACACRIANFLSILEFAMHSCQKGALDLVGREGRQELRLLVSAHARCAEDATEPRRVMVQSLVTPVER